jgi:predicted Ser/Thr protein kinase
MADELKAGRYLIVRELGRGGMGHVYLARDEKLGRNVALKMLPAEITHDSELRRRLAQEARAASALSHPGVAMVFDYVEEGSESFIVFEFVEGRTLRTEMSRHRFATEEILDVGIQLSDALAFAHEHGVVHRDFKPENIMLTPHSGSRGRTKILDFGLAKLLRPISHAASAGVTSAETAAISTAAGLLVGTLNYMSPEQAAMQPVDARSDIFSLGLVLYELAAGVNPFVGQSPTSTIANIIKVDPPPVTERNPVAPPELDRILRKCLRKRPGERYQSARELHVDLNNLRSDSKPAGLPAPRSDELAEMERPMEIARNVARALVGAIQLGYLVMYVIALVKTNDVLAALEMLEQSGLRGATGMGFSILLLVALAGACVRLYLLTAIGMDYADLGRKYRRLFPAALALDLAWSLVAFLLFQKAGWPALLFFVGLAYLPFTQRPLLYSAYSPHGGRTSGLQPAGSS